MKHSKMFRLAAILGIAAMLSSGCSLFKSKETGASIDPPPSDAETMSDMGKDGTATEKNGMQVTLYFKDPKGLVAPVSMVVPKTVSIAKKSLEYMVEGGPGAGLLPNGFQALLPKGTTVKGLNILEDKKLAIVDFSKEFQNYNAQDERKILEAVTWTLTGFPSVEKVSIWVEGRAIKEMPVHNTPVDSELTRGIGINLEFSGNLNVGQTVPVTLFFMNQTADNYTYYVPVTRMVQRTADIAKAAVEQLIKGPDTGKGLASVMAPETGVLQVKVSDDHSLVTVNFNDKLLGSDKKIPVSAAQAVILTLTQTTGASKVQLMVNGDAKAVSTDNQSYSKPVAAPVHINPVKM